MFFFQALQSAYSFKRQPHEMVKHTQSNSSATANESFECVWPFSGVGA